MRPRSLVRAYVTACSVGHPCHLQGSAPFPEAPGHETQPTLPPYSLSITSLEGNSQTMLGAVLGAEGATSESGVTQGDCTELPSRQKTQAPKSECTRTEMLAEAVSFYEGRFLESLSQSMGMDRAYPHTSPKPPRKMTGWPDHMPRLLTSRQRQRRHLLTDDTLRQAWE